MPNAKTDGLSELHRTAFSAAALRAAHSLAGEEPKIFDDTFALALIDMTDEEVAALAKRVPAASASTCIVRSRYAEDRLAAAWDRLRQYVVLGAGLDSYALRMGAGLGAMTVFEVDDPDFQAWKRRRIEALGLAAPLGLRYAPCDFERTPLAAALAESGFREDQPCFVSWLGVTQYLTRAAIEETLRWAGSRPPGSEIVLTFLETNAHAENLKTSMAANGVTLHSHFAPDEMTRMLRGAGFARIEHLGPAEAQARYFGARTDGLSAPQIQRLVSAVVE
jgi:methyltransferase (TIGR00027 family)